ncbi:MAG: type II toxin-antitoxin system VapC family toxin [Planctomycetes bacterium]|nr:type II toxin-antitoxin system VapC family toxin [Planctomycetota bacterium]
MALVTSSPGYEVVVASPSLFVEGLNDHKEHADKEWPLTDCISFLLMEQRGIQNALAYDQHFEQAGFSALLRRDPPITES